MANKIQRYSWWKNELASLGLLLKKRNEFNDIKELSSLVDNIKQTFIHDYKNPSDLKANKQN
jgi:hypothetical protein